MPTEPLHLSAACTPRPSVFERDRRATVLNLDNFLAGKIVGEEFFRENYITAGMTTLFDRCFRQLGGETAGSAVFMLSQSMGGGKTHSMVALGLLAQNVGLRKRVLGTSDPAPSLGKTKVIGFNGRNSEPALGLWGSLATQLGKKETFKDYYTPLSAPGPQAWMELLGGQPVIVLLDELPPYMEHARSVQIGNSDLAVVTATAIANLLIAASETDNIAVVISDLGGVNYPGGSAMVQQALVSSLANVSNEAKRIAVPITPVNPQGDELYHILRCRLFMPDCPDDASAEVKARAAQARREQIEGVANRYRAAHQDAVRMGLTTTQSDGVYQNVLESYPFHPSWRNLLGRFKENEGFQQTRGVIRLMQMIVSNLWNTKRAGDLELIHPYDLDLNDTEIGSEIRSINGNLTEAACHDIADGGKAEAEMIDAKNRNTDAGDASRLILLASLSTASGAAPGLRGFELYDALQRPGRDLSAFKSSVLDLLDTRAWYLYTSADGRMFFKNQQNLAAKMRSTALGLNNETVAKELRGFLEARFAPLVRDAFQSVAVLPALDEVQLEQDKVVLVLTEPGGGVGGLPISADWQRWWAHQTFKNRVMFLTGSRMVMQNVNDCARQVRAVRSIEEEFDAEPPPVNDPQWKALDGLRDRLLNQLASALTQAFDTLVHPSVGDALRSTPITLEFRGNTWHGEDIVRKTLESTKKFTADVGSDDFRQRAEARLFSAKSVLWSEVLRKAAVTTNWPFHSPRALGDLKVRCLNTAHWREQGQYVEKGPFPKPETSVKLTELSRDDNGTTWLRIEPLHGDAVYFETGTNKPTAASSRVTDCQRFEAKHLRYQFLCVDNTAEHPTGQAQEWHAKIDLRYDLRNQGGYRLELRATPVGQARYSTDGTAPDNGAAYEGPFNLPPKCRMVLAIAEADGLRSDLLKILVPRGPGDGPVGPELDPHAPCRWKKLQKLDDTAAVWAWVERLGTVGGLAMLVTINAETEAGDQTVEFGAAAGSGYDGVAVRAACERAQVLCGSPSGLRLRAQSIAFAKGQQLLDWLQAIGQPLNMSEVEQDRPRG